MSVSKPLSAIAPLIGLKSQGSWLYGRFRGYPVAARELGPMENYNIVYQVVLAPESVETVQSALTDKERVKALGLRPGGLRTDAKAQELIYVHQPTFRTKPEDVQRTLESLFSLANASGRAPEERCDICQTNPARGVQVVNGIPTQLCEMDAQKLQARLAQRAQSEAQAGTRYGRGITYGFVGVLLGAGIWAAIGIATGYIFSLAAFGIAGLVAVLLAKGAGKVTIRLMLIMAVMTLLAIFLGDLLWLVVVMTQLGGSFDLGLALRAWFLILSEDRSILLSYFFGILGVIAVSLYMIRARAEAKARFEVLT